MGTKLFASRVILVTGASSRGIAITLEATGAIAYITGIDDCRKVWFEYF
jgi:hypothetical protein